MIEGLTTAEPPFRVVDLKQWVYCRRILYYQHCLPDVRPVTYRMEAGVEAGRAEEGREERRSLGAYGLTAGEREFNVPLSSARLGLRGEVDMVITAQIPNSQTQTPKRRSRAVMPQADGDRATDVIPVDYKDSKSAGPHFRLQLAAYALMLEEARGCLVRRGFLYFIPLRRAEAVPIDGRLRAQLMKVLEGMRRMLEREEMPPAADSLRKCVACEFRRFCNDVL